MIYILHITYPDQSVKHYVGLTTRDRFTQRIKEHRQTKGAILTRDAVMQGADIQVGNFYYASNHALEKALQRTPAIFTFCKLCEALHVNTDPDKHKEEHE